MSRTVIPPAYSDTIISSRPPARRAPLGTSRGSKLPCRARGTASGHAPTPGAGGLRGRTVARVRAPAPGRVPLLIAQVLGQLGLQTELTHRFDHLREEPAL